MTTRTIKETMEEGIILKDLLGAVNDAYYDGRSLTRGDLRNLRGLVLDAIVDNDERLRTLAGLMEDAFTGEDERAPDQQISDDDPWFEGGEEDAE